jgi:hypothetical protein
VDAPEGTSIMLTIVGPSGGAWTVVRETGGWQLYSGRPERPDAEIQLHEDAAWRLFTKGISADQARASARLSGNISLAERALKTISIIA